MVDKLHVPQKNRQPSAEREVRAAVRAALAKQGGEVSGEALVEMFDRLFGAEEKRNRDNWLEVERWAERVGRTVVNATYDAVIDGSLSASQPQMHAYTDFTSLAIGEHLDTDTSGAVFRVGVVSSFTEPTATIIVSAVPVLLESLIPAQSAQSGLGSPSNAPIWDINGCRMASTSGLAAQTWFLRGISVKSSVTVTTPFKGSVYMANVRVNYTDSQNPATVRMTSALSTLEMIATRSFLESPTWNVSSSSSAYLWDCEIGLARNGNYTMIGSAGDPAFAMFGGALSAMNSGVSGATISCSGDGYFIMRGVGYQVASTWEATAGLNWTLSIGGTNFNIVEVEKQNGMAITVTSAAGDTWIRGDYRIATINAASTPSKVRNFRGSTAGTSTFVGPGNFDIQNRAGSSNFQGSSVNARVHASGTSHNPAIVLTGCDDSLIVAVCKQNGGAGAQPYTIDANSDRSILIIGGSTAGFTVAGTNSSTTSVVIDETVSFLTAAAMAEYIRDTMGTALTAGSNIAITVNDAGDTITLAVTGLTSYPGDEYVEDLVNTMVVAGSGMTITYNDVANTLTFTSTGGYTDENAQDAVGTILGNTASINMHYVDATPVINADVVDSYIEDLLTSLFVDSATVDVTVVPNTSISMAVIRESIPQTVLFAASGTFSKATYSGMRAIRVRAMGGGGAGGGAATVAAQASCGAGGAGGGYSEKIIAVGSLGTNETVTVGAAGASSSGAAGGAGGNTTFGAHVTANGGGGGGIITAGTANAVSAAIAGGTATGGDVNISGGASGAALRGTYAGSPAGTAGNGGAAPLGNPGWGGPTTSDAGNNAIVGNAGTGYGAGGSGAITRGTTAAISGGNGAPGAVIVEVLY